MSAHYITHFTVRKLWGYKDYSLQLHEDVNVIIGPNASGKTTLINILYDALTGNVPRLCRTDFSEVSIVLAAFDGTGSTEIFLKHTSKGLNYRVVDKEAQIPGFIFKPASEREIFAEMPEELIRKRMRMESNWDEVVQLARSLAPAVWLPVSRRLPIADEEDVARRSLHRKPLESVDECLSGLLDNLLRYRSSLNGELSELRAEFQRHALENILYDKQHEGASFPNQLSLTPLTETDKDALLKAFVDVSSVDLGMKQRINDHFEAARTAIAHITANPGKMNLNTLFILPLISRTRQLVNFAQELENKREQLFSPLISYMQIANSFFTEKKLEVTDKGEIRIIPKVPQRKALDWRHLSSGEKQILILLTQALLAAESPTLYVADEPELSLHVSWQAMLLGALTKLAGRCQFIIATHSPDVASEFGDKIIDLARQ